MKIHPFRVRPGALGRSLAAVLALCSVALGTAAAQPAVELSGGLPGAAPLARQMWSRVTRAARTTGAR